MTQTAHIVIIGAGVGGLTTAGLLAKAGYQVTVIEANTYPGGSAGTFSHKGYRFDAGATVAGGFQPNGPHALSGALLDIDWNVHQHDPAWVVHLPNRTIKLCADNADVEQNFPGTEAFWQEQHRIAQLAWKMSAQGLPFPPTDIHELLQLAKVGLLNFPQDLQMIPFAFSSVYQWLSRKGLGQNREFVRFLDAQLLISAQTTTPHVNALYGATALDLSQQGVFHVEGGIGGLSEQLADKLTELGGEILYRHAVSRISIDKGRANGVYVTKGKRNPQERFIPADVVIANTTPWSLDALLGDDSPKQLQREVQRRNLTQGAFVLHVGVNNASLPKDVDDHHQVIVSMDGELGEGRSIFVSMSPEWDTSRAPNGYRAVTVSTHTQIQPWWDLLATDKTAYAERKQAYAERMIAAIDTAIPGFKAGAELILPGTPVTYQFYTQRHMGMVGGFPQTSLFKARGPKTGVANIRLVGDSIFPGQSTAGVTLGAIRVAQQVTRTLSSTQAMQTYTYGKSTS
jgi:C-3',4' desaturase CrtD